MHSNFTHHLDQAESDAAHSDSTGSSPSQQIPGRAPRPVAEAAGPGWSDHRFGTFLVILGVIGLVATAVVVTIGFRFVDRTGSTVAQSLDLTSDAITTVEETVAATADALGIAAGGLDTLRGALDTAGESLDGVDQLIADATVTLGSDVPESIDAIRDTVPALVQSAELLETALGAVSFLGIDYAPEIPPAESLQRVDDALVDVAVSLRDGADELAAVGSDVGTLGSDIRSLDEDLAALASNLERADGLVEGYAGTANSVAALVAATSAELDAQRTEGQLLVVMFGAILALLQIVPIAFGLRLRRRAVGEARFAGSTAGYEPASHIDADS